VVVALHLEDDAVAIADIDDPGILARPVDHAWALRGEGPQPFLRGFIRAVLVPHRREDAELGVGRRPADEAENLLVFVGLEAVVGHELGRNLAIVVELHLTATREGSMGPS